MAQTTGLSNLRYGVVKCLHFRFMNYLQSLRDIFQKSERRKFLEARGKLREDETTPPPSSDDEPCGPLPVKPAMRKSRIKKTNFID